MENKIHTLNVNLNWRLVNLISKLDRFDATWTTIEKKEGQSLKQLRNIATVRSVGASTRIEGVEMRDEEIEIFLDKIDITKTKDRDEQEVLGYFETLNLIIEVYQDIDIKEDSIKRLHNILMKHNIKDNWHKGDYKKHENSVQATLPNGKRQIIFKTTPVGYPTEDGMRELLRWYNTDKLTHPLVKCAVFVYEFLSIHPFQDGNGRLSRLLTTLLLLKEDYKWIQYVSFEHEIENRKTEYYRELRNCQGERPNENITSWIIFFFDALENVQSQLTQKLENKGVKAQLTQKEKLILLFIEEHPNCNSSQIANKLKIASSSIKRSLKNLRDKNLINKEGKGRGTNYTVS